MKNIGLLLVLLSIMSCGEEETKENFVIEEIVEVDTTPQEEKDQSLIEASENGHLEIVKYLLENGADVNQQVEIEGSGYEYEDEEESIAYSYTALMDASENGHLEVVKYLIQNGADVNTKDFKGCTALAQASDKGHIEIVKLLIKNGADVNAKNYLCRW